MNDMVTIPHAEYDRLRAAAEDLMDLQSLDRAKAVIASVAEERIPADIADRLIDGDSPLRIYREYRGLSQTALSRASGVNRVQIADIEAGRATGSLVTVGKLTRTLRVGLEDLTRPAE